VEGRVVGVSDGDTITVLDESKTQHKIRFAGIDAPEKG
jgi:endonuclease YncB( thermonuclease family)